MYKTACACCSTRLLTNKSDTNLVCGYLNVPQQQLFVAALAETIKQLFSLLKYLLSYIYQKYLDVQWMIFQKYFVFYTN